MSKKEKKAKGIALQEDIKLDIPEDEIWTYQVEGLAAPHINKPYKHFGFKKIIFTIIIVIAVSLSCYFSVRTVQKDTFEYEQTQTGYELTKFSNTGEITELNVDYVTSVAYDQITKEYVFTKDESKKVTEIREYALNCDDKIKTIYIGADVELIQNNAFYSCWALERIEVDDSNR